MQKGSTGSTWTNFNPPAPCGAGPVCCQCPWRCPRISIHPPRAGRDYMMCDGRLIIDISIHPPRAGRDMICARSFLWRNHFNPPAPCGAGPQRHLLASKSLDFNPPAPCGAGLRRLRYQWRVGHFNPPAPCGAGRFTWVTMCSVIWYFNPPAPCGAGHPSDWNTDDPAQFQSTRPVRGGTASLPCARHIWHFNPPAPCGAGRALRATQPRRINFNPPAPCGAGRDFVNKNT